MNHPHDPLGIYQLTKEIHELKAMIRALQPMGNPFDDLIPEIEFSERIKISASTLRQWRGEGRYKHAWVKRGRHIFWSARLFREETEE